MGDRQARGGGRLPDRRAGARRGAGRGAGPVDVPLVPRAGGALALPAVRPSRAPRPAPRRRAPLRASTAPPATTSTAASGSSDSTSIRPRSKNRPAGQATGAESMIVAGALIVVPCAQVGVADDAGHAAAALGLAVAQRDHSRSSSRPPLANSSVARPDADRPARSTSATAPASSRARSAAPGRASRAAFVGSRARPRSRRSNVGVAGASRRRGPLLLGAAAPRRPSASASSAISARARASAVRLDQRLRLALDRARTAAQVLARPLDVARRARPRSARGPSAARS